MAAVVVVVGLVAAGAGFLAAAEVLFFAEAEASFFGPISNVKDLEKKFIHVFRLDKSWLFFFDIFCIK